MEEEGSAEEKKTVVDCILGLLTLYSDGSYERLHSPAVPACPTFDEEGLATADITLDPAINGTWARVFMPQPPIAQLNKLPVVLHFHGGGFCIGSPSHAVIHDFCSKMALLSTCIWISLEYRLAPEHRLPAAFDDAFEALLWLRAQALLQCSEAPGTLPVEAMASATSGTSDCIKDAGETLALQWLNQYADFSNTFLAGESAGGTIAHFTAARASSIITELKPLQMRGVILIHPGFKTEKPIVAGSLHAAPALLPLSRLEFYVRAALPEGADWGHPFVNPMHPQAPFKLSETELPAVLVAVAGEDVLRPGGEQYYKALKEAGKPNVQLFLSEGVGHCFHVLSNPSSEAAAELLKHIIKFIQDNTSSSSSLA